MSDLVVRHDGKYRLVTLRNWSAPFKLKAGTIIIPDVSYWGSDNEPRVTVLEPVGDGQERAD